MTCYESYLQKVSMKLIFVVVACVVHAGCGAETATTAATGAAVKQQEVEAGKKTMERAQQEIGQAMEETKARAEKNEP